MFRLVLISAIISTAFLIPQSVNAQPASEAEALKKENELLKKEIELLKKEIDLLKTEIATKPAGSKNEAANKTTLHGVEYEFVSLKMDGNVGELRIAATNKSGKPIPFRVTAPVKLTTADGKQHRSGVSSTGRPWELQQDVRVEIPMKMGNIPSDFAEVTTIFIEVVDGNGLARARSNPLMLKGKFIVER